MLVSPSMSPALGVFITSSNHMTHRQGLTQYRRDRHGAKSAPPLVWHKRNQYLNNPKNPVQKAPTPSSKNLRKCSTAGTRRVPKRQSAGSSNENGDMKLRIDDVVWLAEQTREVTSQENRRSVMEVAQKTIRQETSIPDSSRPHSVIGVGLQSMTSPMPLSAHNRRRPGQVDHIPVLLNLPSDRTFIPSSDQDHARHLTTPAEDHNDIVQEDTSQPVAKQCCEIMGPSLCRTCRKLESRLLNREQAEKECPRMRITQENITTTQVVKRLYPRLTDSEIQDKIARGEIARTGFPPSKCRLHRRRFDSSSSDNDSSDSEGNGSSSEESIVKKENKKQKLKFSCQHVSTLMLELAKLKSKLKNQTSTPLFFTDLKRVQAKIISGEVDRKKYLTKEPKETSRLKSAISSISTASSTKTTLSKLGVRLSESLMPVFVSPRKVKTHEEPSYKAFYEPPLLSKRRQIPNPSFFAGSSESYSLPERLPDIIEFADSKIKLLEKQGRSMSSMSIMSNFSEECDNAVSDRAGESGRSGDNIFNLSNSQRDLKMQLSIQEQSELESNSNHEEQVSESGQEKNRVDVNTNDIATANQNEGDLQKDLLEGCSELNNNEQSLYNSTDIKHEAELGVNETIIKLGNDNNDCVDGGCNEESDRINDLKDDLDDNEDINEQEDERTSFTNRIITKRPNVSTSVPEMIGNSANSKDITGKLVSSFMDENTHHDNGGESDEIKTDNHNLNDEDYCGGDDDGDGDGRHCDGDDDNDATEGPCTVSSSDLGDSKTIIINGVDESGEKSVGFTLSINVSVDVDTNRNDIINTEKIAGVEEKEENESFVDNSLYYSETCGGDGDFQNVLESQQSNYGDNDDEDEESTGHRTRHSVYSDD